ncbi:MAG TPA: flagellar hook-length control protein FliK [Tianweitania sediminis]|nr:flagellar hook-length control protein FliK [Tianweitania sediminis]
MMPIASAAPHAALDPFSTSQKNEGQAPDAGPFGDLLEKPAGSAKTRAREPREDNEELGEPKRKTWSALHLLLASETTVATETNSAPSDPVPSEEDAEREQPDGEAIAIVLQVAAEQRPAQIAKSNLGDDPSGAAQMQMGAEADPAAGANRPAEMAPTEATASPAAQPAAPASAPAAVAPPPAAQAIVAAPQAALAAPAMTRAAQNQSLSRQDVPEAPADTNPKTNVNPSVEVVFRPPAPVKEPTVQWSPPADNQAQPTEQDASPPADDRNGGAPLPTPSTPPSAATSGMALPGAAPLALDPVEQPALVEAARRVTEAEVTSQSAGPSETLKLRLNPLHLGLVTAVLRGTADGLVVELQVETAEAHARLVQDRDAIGNALADVGVSVDRITVQHVPGAAAASGREADYAGSLPQANNGTPHDPATGNRNENRGNPPAQHRNDGSEGRGGSSGSRQDNGSARPDGGRYI